MSGREAPKRPPGTTMEGMIWNANHVLDMAVAPGSNGIPANMIRACKGIVLLNVVDVGAIFAGSSGSGVALTKNEDGEWSAPSAMMLKGVKLTWIIGQRAKDFVILLMTDEHLKLVTSNTTGLGLMMSSDTVVGRENLGAASTYLSNKGVGGVPSYTFEHPSTFIGTALKGLSIYPVNKENKRFYSEDVTPQEILIDRSVHVPADSTTTVAELHKKLALMAEGKITPLVDDEKKEMLRKAAAVKAESVKVDQGDSVVEVNAEKDCNEQA